MEYQTNESGRPVNPRRKRRTKMQIFKEAYLPTLIVAVAIVLIIVFIIGSITRAVQKNKADKAASIAASESIAAEEARIAQQVQDLIDRSKVLAAGYDYNAAIALLNSFEGDISKHMNLNDQILEYEAAQKAMVPWEDPSMIPNLSFQLLVADPARGFSHSDYGYSINRNFITTVEFSKILQQLYDNGYILVDLNDFISSEETANGTITYKAKTMYLPKGKKPIMLTQTNVNYNYYLIDSDGDKVPDANGTGIASKLLWDGSSFSCEMVDASGNTVVGDYDMVPILESFIKKHPDFSYCGARAVLALTGYNGLFGYRTHESARSIFGEVAYDNDIAEAKKVAKALQDTGYTLACYTYENIPYGTSSLTQIQSDMSGWTSEVVPILGKIDILVYAQLSDITSEQAYSGEKYQALQDLGFRYYLGFCEAGTPWTTIANNYVRQGRILVAGANLAHHADWFANLFDASVVLDTTRGEVPQ